MVRLIYGCGYLGRRVGSHWRADGDEVGAVTRSDEHAIELAKLGFWTIGGDVTQPDTLLEETGPFGAPETVLYAVGYDRGSDQDIETVYAGGLRNVLASLPDKTKRVIYISTTGVYGPAEGALVDEQTPPDPRRAGGKASLAAEQELATHPLGRSSAILRLAGIYGPGRIPYLDKLQAGEPIAAPSEGWLNLIHVADAARIVVKVDQWLAEQSAADRPHVFNVSDGVPVVRGDYYRAVAEIIGAPSPQFVSPDSDSPAAARAASDKRIGNGKLRQTVPVRLKYPSYREGLSAILSG